MTNTPGSGWPGAPPPQGHGPTPPWGPPSWPTGAAPQGRPQPPAGQPYPGSPYPGQPGAAYPDQPYPGNPGAAYPDQPYPGNPGAAYPGQPYPGNPGAAYPGQPGAAHPGRPGAADPGQAQPTAAQPGDQSAPGFDPRQALGAQPPASVSINQFTPPPNRTPVLITLAALITLVLVIGGGIYVRSLPAGTPSASPSAGSATPAGPGHPFNTPDERQRGRWEILDSAWTDEGLQLQLRIYADTGSIRFSFMAFSNATTEVVTPTASPRSPDIRTGVASVSQPATGYVFFPMTRGDATIILANGSGRQMSALPVKG